MGCDKRCGCMCVRSRSALRDRRRRSRQPAERRSTKTTVSEVEPASTGVERSSALVVSWVIHSSAFENVLPAVPSSREARRGASGLGGRRGRGRERGLKGLAGAQAAVSPETGRGVRCWMGTGVRLRLGCVWCAFLPRCAQPRSLSDGDLQGSGTTHNPKVAGISGRKRR
jgi:hypothetical protein